MLKMRNVIALISLLLITLPLQAFDYTSLLNEADKKARDMLEGISPKTADNPLTILISKDLKINPKQAAGGAGSMLAMAYQLLDKKQSTELLKLLPEMDALTEVIPAHLGSNLSNLTDVNQAFKLLDLDSSMVKKFTPVLLGYLDKKGATGALITSLSALWDMKKK